MRVRKWKGERCRKRGGGDSRDREGDGDDLGLGEDQVQVKELEGLKVGGREGRVKEGRD